MHIKNILLENFRNYDNQEIELNENINIIYGNNAQGKTNIIESVFLCAYGKSFRAKKDQELIKFDKENCKVEVSYSKIDREGTIKAEIRDKKTFFANGVKQNKISDIIGKINIVIFTPDDIEIIKDGPQKRRRFLDMMISSLRPNYLHLLNSYNKILEQRNNYLRQIKLENKNPSMLDIWDEQLSEYSFKIFEYRKYFVDKISNSIEDIHSLITKSGKEGIKIKYISNSKNKESFLENLKKSRTVDIKKGFTATGVHRDDFMIYINSRPVSIFGSQGQQRTAILTLKLCELKIVKEEIGDTPILLLDDYMSELDENRRTSFLENIKGNQVIITCTDRIDLENESSIYYVENGICKKV
ncbi:MAG: DNA replication/repair protein RecF [Clostridia bacterium]|nr:DNA replication/repair protein RecF [Clostridia bacterium]